tara:strand:- start:293 stop:814 length:522 start_codon:yes stop_codon:yes gene_type:complete
MTNNTNLILSPKSINFFKIPKKHCPKKMAISWSAEKVELYKINEEDIIFKTCISSKYYHNEKKIYHLLQNEDFLPKLRYFDNENLILGITDVGNSLPILGNINLKNYEKELISIIDVMEQKYKLYHNDLRPNNICIDKNNIIRLIDFDRTSNKQKENKYIFKENIHNFPKYYY